MGMGPYETSLHTARQARLQRMWLAGQPVAKSPSNDNVTVPDDVPLPDFVSAWLNLPTEPSHAPDTVWSCGLPPGVTIDEQKRRRPPRIIPVAISSRMPEIIRSVAAEFHMTQIEIMGETRTRAIVLARHIVMFLGRKVCGYSLPKIGQRLNNRDHTTILHGIRRIERLIATDPVLAAQVSKLEALFIE